MKLVKRRSALGPCGAGEEKGERRRGRGKGEEREGKGQEKIEGKEGRAKRDGDREEEEDYRIGGNWRERKREREKAEGRKKGD